MVISMPSPPSKLSFGDAIRQRRDELGLTKADVADKGGPAGTTLGKLEAGLIKRPRASTFLALDAALDWTAGTSARLFHTGHADPQVGAEARTGGPDSSHPSRSGLLIKTSELADLITWNTLLSKHLAEIGDSTSGQYTERITGITNALLGRWIDQAIERGHEVELRLLVNILASQPMVPPEHPDFANQLYRRWRLGIITDAQVSPAVLAEFRAYRLSDPKES